jgi:glyoxylase-like metal-dependent hydrolase (beta-lactamase superfamily II)
LLLHTDDLNAALPVDEAALEKLGILRIEVPVPFIEAGGPVNVYALAEKDGGWTLFDSGVATAEGRRAVREGLHACGVELKKVRRIVVSHGHVDHYGNAQELAEESGASVFVHPDDEQKICGEGRWAEMLRKHLTFYRRLGVPEDVLDQMMALGGSSADYARSVERPRVKHLGEGETLELLHFTVEVLHMPGHTPGLLCLWDPTHRILFADDHILARVSPNPLIDLTRAKDGEKPFRALVAYLQSAKRAYALDAAYVLPGHGPAFTNHRPLLDGLFSFYARRQERLLKRVQKGPATVFELMNLLFARADPKRMYLMLSEAVGNLEVMEEDGRIKRTLEGGVWKFGAA